MTIAIASGDRQRVVLVADTLAVQGDGHRADAFVSKVLPFAHCAAAAVVRGHGGHKLAIHMAMNTRPALDGIGALPWPAILDRYVGDDQEQFDMLLAGWAPAAGGLAIWRFGEATGYELAEVALPASVALPDFGVALDPVMADGAVIHAAEVLVDLPRVKFHRHGVPDKFVEVGPPAALYAHYRLDAPGIAAVAREVLG